MAKLMVNLVVGMSKNRVIGRDQKVPWRVRADLGRLKKLTTGEIVILGRKTYESMDEYYRGTGREMPGKLYLVVSRDTAFTPQRANARRAGSVAEALGYPQDASGGDVYVIGGGQIFAECLNAAGRIYMTEIETEVDGDTYFPELDPKLWREVERETFPADDRNDYPYTFLTLERVI
jgi:dihydrofolate reductase